MRKNLVRKATVGLMASGLLLGGVSTAYAGTGFSNYSTTVGNFNGSGYTANQTKAISGAFGYVYTGYVGGGYEVDARMQRGDGAKSGDWVRNFQSGYSTDRLDNSILSGETARVQFSNDFNTTVDVQVSGNWRSN